MRQCTIYPRWFTKNYTGLTKSTPQDAFDEAALPTIPRTMPSGSKKRAKRNVDTRGSSVTISTTFHRSTDASTHLNPGPFTEHESFDRIMRSENHTPRPCAPDQLCVVNMDQNLCLVYYIQVQTFWRGHIVQFAPLYGPHSAFGMHG